MQDYLGIDERLLGKLSKWNYRINTPATSAEETGQYCPFHWKSYLIGDKLAIKDMLIRTDEC
jgi:hypothetical protein